MRTLRNGWIVLACGWLLCACGSEKAAEEKPDVKVDGQTPSDTIMDTGADSSLPVDVSTAVDAAQDLTAPDAFSCSGGLPACNDPNGKADLSLCPKPFADYTCTAGCCVKKLICTIDSDCTGFLGTPNCPDVRFACACDQDTGACGPSMCKIDAECPGGKQCHQGGCLAVIADGELAARLLRPVWITSGGNELDAIAGLGAQAVDAKGNVAAAAKFTFALAAGDSFTLVGGLLKATAKPGKATVTATVTGSTKPASNPATLWNLGPLPAGKNLRVTAIDDVTQVALAGKVVIVGLADAATPEAAMTADLADGQASFAAVKFPCDIHVLGTDHAPISVLRYDPGQAGADLLLPAPLYHNADLEFDVDGKLVADKSKLDGGDLITGKVDYQGQGEAGLGVTSLAFGPGLLSFQIESILGPRVKRPFDKEAPGIVNPEPGKPQDIPGGVTFLLGKPVVTRYVLAGTPGKHTLWTLAGRVALSDILPAISDIVGNIAGGIDIGKIVGSLLPYLGTFQSEVVFDVAFGQKLSQPLQQLDLKPTFPLLNHIDITMPALPEVAAGSWADVAFVIGGAMMPAGEIIPLGLTAGADRAGENDPKADGKVDGDPTAVGVQSLGLNVAPLHSGTRFGIANHVLVTAAVVVADKAQNKKEGGSIQISEPGVVPGQFTPEPFLPFPVGSTYDVKTATLTMKAIDGAHFYRATVSGSDSRQWLIVLPTSLAGKALTLPDLTAYGATLNLAAAPKRVFVAAFELRKAVTFTELLTTGALNDLVRKVKRTAFYDAMP